MNLHAKLKRDQLTARKGKKLMATKLLTYILGELERIQKGEVSDAVVEKLLIKLKKDLPDQDERNLIGMYLPYELTQEQLVIAIANTRISNPDANMGQLMRALKEDSQKHKYLYNGKLASQLIKELL